MARPVARRGEGRPRVLDAALRLFAEHGVSGTSLHMIADELGVTKAAVYYQFQTKEALVRAVLEPAFRRMAELVATAEATPSPAEQVDTTLVGLVDLVVDHRRVAAALRGDPAAGHVADSLESLHTLVTRLVRLLSGADPTTARRVAASMVVGGLMLSGVDPQLADLDDETLRRELLRFGRRALAAADGFHIAGPLRRD